MRVAGTTYQDSKTKIYHIGFLLLTVLSTCFISSAQEKKTGFYENVSLDIKLKNMHTWHGFVVTPGPMVASSLEHKFYRDKFTIGLWGGSSLNGDYTELSYYLNYNTGKNFKASLISHNNYSNWADPNIFSWNKNSSPNFLDIVLETSISENFPLHIYFSTILFGQGGDFEINSNENETNSFSHYLELRYPVFLSDKMKVNIFAGGAFSLFTEKHFTPGTITW